MYIRHALLAGVAFFAVSTAASAQNAVTTVQLGGVNSSSTYQQGRGDNTAVLGQVGVFGNTASATQLSSRGSNLSAVGQASFGPNSAIVLQAAPRGNNTSGIGQVSYFGPNSAIVGQASSPFGANASGVTQINLRP